MKLATQLLLFVFILFLATPTLISVIKKKSDTSVFYSFSEEEKGFQEVKAVLNFDIIAICLNFVKIKSSLILSENLSKHDQITSQIFIPPPETI